MEILLAALVAATVSGFVALVAPRVRRRPALVDGAQGAPVPSARRRGHAKSHRPTQADAGYAHDLADREAALRDREREIAKAQTAVDQTREQQLRELERLSGLSVAEARRALLAELEDELRHERARLIRQVEDETRHDAERRARSILAASMRTDRERPHRPDDSVTADPGRLRRAEGQDHRARGARRRRAPRRCVRRPASL